MRKLTAVAGVHVRNERRTLRVQVGDHLGMFSHVVQLCNAQICHAQAGRGRPGASLEVVQSGSQKCVSDRSCKVIPCKGPESPRIGQSALKSHRIPPGKR